LTRRVTGTVGTCVDCPPGLRRPARKPGPRCVTHQRDRRKRLSEARWARHIWVTYELTPEDYYAILEVQAGVCYICERANGRTKKLSVDHNHATGEVRGLLCGPCNRDVLGHLRDSTEALQRGIDYLTNPPARAVLLRRRKKR
jgi:hypothetical protein